MMASAAKKTTRDKSVQDALRAMKGGKSTKKSTKKKATKKKATKKATKKKATKRKTTKRATAKKASRAKTEKPSSGQSGPALELSVDKVNSKETKILEALNGSGSGSREIWTIEELGAECFKSKSKKQQNSWTRNSLRRLIRSGMIEKVERGKYRVSDSGRKKLARAA
jgi:hypothetical protein